MRRGIFVSEIFFLRSFLAIFHPKFETSTTPTMAGSLQSAAQSPPNPTNTITNVTATGGGVGGVDSDAITVAITAEAADKWTDDGSDRLFTSEPKARAKRGPKKQHKTHNNQSGCGRGVSG